MTLRSAVLATAGIMLAWRGGDDCRPVLPRTGPTSRLILLDVLKESSRSHHPEAQSALQAITCLQGLVNRDDEVKIYLLNFPWRLHWDWERKAAREIPGWKHPARAALDDGLVPFPAAAAELDPGKEYPALHWLLKRYVGRLKGKALCPESGGKTRSGALAAAVNACTFEGALPLTGKLDAWARAEGFDLPLLADLREMDNARAFQWSAGRYLKDPRRNRALAGYLGDIGSNSPIMNDYFVATGTFCYFLHTETKNDPDAADVHYDVIADPKHYPPGTVHVGPVEGGNAIQRLQRRGHTVVCGFLANASVTSSLPARPEAYPPARAEARPVDPKGLYLAWEIEDDGDGFDVLSLSMYSRLRCDAAFGKIPGGVRVNPYLIDLFPSLFGWFAGRPQTDVIASMNDGGASLTKGGQAGWVRTYRHYLDHSNGSIGIVNFFGIYRQPFLLELEIPFIIAGYLGEPKGPEWQVWDNRARTVHTTILGSGSNQRGIDETLANAWSGLKDDGRPAFFLCRSKESAVRVKERMEQLLASPPAGRKVYWLTPGDLAATYRAWRPEPEVKRAPRRSP